MPEALPNAAWIDPARYPFRTFAHPTPAGTLRYLDEGSGPPLVLVHGNPTWSYVYRKLVLALRGEHRCVAMDHLGFGQSDKPVDFSYEPQAHAGNLTSLLTALDLHDVTLVVQDWGGPIGLSWALDHLDRVRRVVILNTWMWPVDDDWYYQAFSGFMGGPPGRYLCRHHNFFVNGVMPAAYGDRALLTPEDLQHYRDALPTPESRRGTWVFPGQIIAATPWLRDLWARRELLTRVPVQIAWGMKDIAFRPKELRRWREALPAARVLELPRAGHYVQDEASEEIASALRTPAWPPPR